VRCWYSSASCNLPATVVLRSVQSFCDGGQAHANEVLAEGESVEKALQQRLEEAGGVEKALQLRLEETGEKALSVEKALQQRLEEAGGELAGSRLQIVQLEQQVRLPIPKPAGRSRDNTIPPDNISPNMILLPMRAGSRSAVTDEVSTAQAWGPF